MPSHYSRKKIVFKKKDLQKRLELFSALNKLPKKLLQTITPFLSSECTDYICEALYNTINVDLNLKEKDKRRLRKAYNKCNNISSLCNKSTHIHKKRQLLKQKGGFLGALLGVAIPTIVQLISSLTKK